MILACVLIWLAYECLNRNCPHLKPWYGLSTMLVIAAIVIGKIEFALILGV